MTDFFTRSRKALFWIAGATAILGVTAQSPLFAQSPTEPYPFETQAVEDHPNANGVLAPLRFTAPDIMLTGDGQMGSIPPQSPPHIATDGRGGTLEDAWRSVEPDAISGFAFVP